MSLVTVAPDRAVDPNAPEVVAPGDIPDNQVFVPYHPGPGTYTVRIPEGWARTVNGDAVTFGDHYNSVTVTTWSSTTAPTVSTVRRNGLADVSGDATFRLGNVAAVSTRSGPAVHATYEIGSHPDPVTGKKALLAVERYVFFRNDTVLTLTLAGAKGADNVDPWRVVRDSVRID